MATIIVPVGCGIIAVAAGFLEDKTLFFVICGGLIVVGSIVVYICLFAADIRELEKKLNK
jgi:hypothetical protein